MSLYVDPCDHYLQKPSLLRKAVYIPAGGQSADMCVHVYVCQQQRVRARTRNRDSRVTRSEYAERTREAREDERMGEMEREKFIDPKSGYDHSTKQASVPSDP